MTWIELSFEAISEAVDWVYTRLAEVNYVGEIQVKKLGEAGANWVDEGDRLAEFVYSVHLYLQAKSQADVDQTYDLFSSLYRTGMISELRQRVLSERPSCAEPSVLPSTRIGRFVVLPCQPAAPPQLGTDIVIQLRPMLAFGSGFHPATQLTLHLLERFVTPGMDALDLGSGSGILTVAMAKLGAQVVALDNDRTAVEATQTSVELNQVAAQVTVIEGSLGQGHELGHWMGGEVAETAFRFAARDRFDLIVANIFARVHIALAADFRQALRSSRRGGWLIAAGFTADYEPEITAAFAEQGFAVVECERLGEWVAIAFRLVENF